MKRPTMSDVAKAAGVSDATVSYVINNGPRSVSDDTRLRVLSAIETLGYRPHAIARSLKKGRTQTVGFLVQNLISPFISNLVNEIEQNLAKHGYGLILASAHEEIVHEAHMLNTLASQSIDGLLYIPTSSKNHLLVNRLLQEGMPVVLVDRYIQGVPADVVMTDHISAAEIATNYLIQKGCRRIFCISFSEDASSALDRVEGYRRALLNNGIPINENYIFIYPYASGESIEIPLMAQINAFGLPDGILCTTDNMLIEVAKLFQQSQIRIPDQVRITGGFFNSPWNDLLTPPLPVVNQRYEVIAEYAVNSLLERINGNKEPPRIRLVDVDFFHN